MCDQVPTPTLNDGEKALIRTAVVKYLPTVLKWLLSDHDSPVLRLVAKGVRWGLAAAGAGGAGGAVLSDPALAKAADWALVLIPMALEVASHFRERLAVWIDRKFPRPATPAVFPPKEEIK